ncbi:class I SAM-dependent methyltransferase [Pelagibacteraceae bacterium]|nr:class I SAM-dependent methyltransferase [Pelagibacteraceae bacterium]
MNFKFKRYWRKTGLDEKWGNNLLQIILEKKPKNFLEIGVFCGVTSRNVCELLNIIHHGNFSYMGFDLFGEKLNQTFNEVEPEYIRSQKFSNPLKHLYYNIILKENLNSKESIEKFLNKFIKNITLVKGDTNRTLKEKDLSKIDFAFIDGGHSYATTYNDLSILYSFMKDKKKTIICDDYIDASYITEVKKAVDDFVKKNNLSLKVIEEKFALIIT